jgi:hypothetical protein
MFQFPPIIPNTHKKLDFIARYKYIQQQDIMLYFKPNTGKNQLFR